MSAAAGPRIVSLVGNPRPQSRTHGLARTLAEQIARVLGATEVVDVDLAPFGPRVLDPADAAKRPFWTAVRTTAVPTPNSPPTI